MLDEKMFQSNDSKCAIFLEYTRIMKKLAPNEKKELRGFSINILQGYFINHKPFFLENVLENLILGLFL